MRISQNFCCREKVTDKHKYKFYSTLYIPLLVRYLPGHVLPPPHPPCKAEISYEALKMEQKHSIVQYQLWDI
jgi:hypothetical protein